MEVNKDFEELLALFNEHRVEYVVVGGYAVAFHGAPRYTQDIDLFYRASLKNAQALLRALEAFGFGSLNISANDLTTLGKVIQLGSAPNRVDLLNDLSATAFDSVWEAKVQGSYGDVQLYFIDVDNLRINKKATGRAKDLGDLEQLDTILEQPSDN